MIIHSNYFFYLILLLSFIVAKVLNSKLQRYSRVKIKHLLSGKDIAVKMLRENGIEDVSVTTHPYRGEDYYDPDKKNIHLSKENFYDNSVSAIAIAAHESGHAVQQAKDYKPLNIRTAMVPAVRFSSRCTIFFILFGALMMHITKIPLLIGIVFFASTTLFSLIALPVEFDASRRALKWIQEANILSSQEMEMARDALKWAALTYVVAALGSVLELIHYVSLLYQEDNRRS